MDIGLQKRVFLNSKILNPFLDLMQMVHRKSNNNFNPLKPQSFITSYEHCIIEWLLKASSTSDEYERPSSHFFDSICKQN